MHRKVDQDADSRAGQQGCGAVCLDKGNIEGSCLLQEGTGCYSGKDSGETQEKALKPESPPKALGVSRNKGNHVLGGPP